MEERVKAITDFANSKSFDIKENIIQDIRSQINNPVDYNVFINGLKEKMLILDFIETYEIEDMAWNWVEGYYGVEENYE